MKETTLHSVCPLDCPDNCSLGVEIKGGKVFSIDASPINPVTGGFICSKVRAFGERIYGQDRLLSPLRRTGSKGSGQFEPITWEEAIRTITGRFAEIREEHGAEAILPFSYDGSNGLLTAQLVDAAYFRRLGASRLDQTVCASPTSAAADGMYGAMPCADMSQDADAEHIVT